MGSVHLVRDDHGREYAVKTVRSDRIVGQIELERFRREAEVALRLQHPNVVRTHEVSQTTDGVHYLVAEYCSHGSTYRYLQKWGLLPADLALFWLIGVTRALDYTWSEHRVVHRDIKPDNLLVGEDYQIKITDFGLARLVDSPASRLTAEGATVGTVFYMPPEQIHGSEDLDVRADLYAAGAAFYELVSGVPPYPGSTRRNVMLRHLHDPLFALAKRRPGVPQGLSDCIGWLLAKPREERPDDPATLLERLLELASELGVDPDSVPESIETVGQTAEFDSPWRTTSLKTEW
jgi:serine/threonine-protein kinase